MTLSIIAAMDRNRVIGFQNKIPWHLSEDLKRFKEITMSHPIIMGRKTFESLGRPLPGRENIVITRNRQYAALGATVVHSLAEAIFNIKDQDAFVIGGAQIFNEALLRADVLYLTLIAAAYKGDTYFPEVDFETTFKIVETSEDCVSNPDSIRYKFLKAIRRTN